MSRIDKSSSINELLKTMSSKQSRTQSSSESDSGIEKNASSAPTGVESLKQEIVNALHSLPSETLDKHNAARKILISKMIQWKFQDLVKTPAQMSYLVEMVNKSIQQEQSAALAMNRLVDEMLE